MTCAMLTVCDAILAATSINGASAQNPSIIATAKGTWSEGADPGVGFGRRVKLVMRG